MGMIKSTRRVLGAARNLRFYNRYRLHELWEQTHLRQLFRHFEVDCVFDVGANYGQYATMLRTKAGFKGLIVSFEPIPTAAAALRKAAKHDPLWIVEELAIAKTDGQQNFNIMKSSSFSSLSAARHDDTDHFRAMNAVQEVITVQTENLATAYRRLAQDHSFQRPFLKLDTQGFDIHIVQAGSEVLHYFIGLQSELAVKKLYVDSVDFRSAITAYEECGFQLSAFVPNNEGHFPVLMETDCIMVRHDLAANPDGR